MICMAKIFTNVQVYLQGNMNVHINFEGMTLRKPPRENFKDKQKV